MAALGACGDNGINPNQTDASVPTNPDAAVAQQPVLVGRAILPAATFAQGPMSGANLGSEAINGQELPFSMQPVQGFSGIARGAEAGTFLALSDNGFGAMENSADYLLRIYRIQPDFLTQNGGSGAITVDGFISLRDPDRHLPFTIVNDFTTERLLTGADLDIESLQVAADGTLWIGDEFGPFILHFSAEGVLLEPPFRLPDFDNPGQFIHSPQNPFNEEGSAVRIMNALRTHARQNGNDITPVFSPYHVMLKYEGSNANAHYARGEASPADLAPAASDVFDVASIQRAGYSVVTWTVNDLPRMQELLTVDVDGIITDRPDLLLQAVQDHDADGDGVPGDYLTSEGLIDITQFDAQGHRGARNLRPENTLPAMEAALDYLMTTLETDTGITSDNIPVLGHDPYIQTDKCRRADGTPYDTPVLIKDFTAQEIQATYICDRLIRGEPQTNDRALSPVSMQFAQQQQLIDPYVIPTVDQLFAFVEFYADYYRIGPGQMHPDAERRVTNAERVRFNIETKLNPRSDTDARGNVYSQRTTGPDNFADRLAGVISRRGLTDRADIQSFDFRTLLRVHQMYPAIRTAFLFGDFPIFNGVGTDDGTNLQDEAGANTPWLGGLFWPYRVTAQTQPLRLGRSGGFEGMALSADGKKLYALLEKTLDGVGQDLWIHEFDIESKEFTGIRWRYTLDSADHAIGDFVMLDDTHGLVIERDNLQGAEAQYKVIHRITLGEPGTAVAKAVLVDLMDIADPYELGIGEDGDIGVGGGTFSMPFETIENVIVLEDNRIGVLDDNNFPFSVGRHVGSGAPDDTEFIVIELPEPLVAGQ